VTFENCNITNVSVDLKLTQALEEKTKLKYSLENHIKEYSNQKLTVENEQAQALTDVNRENDRKMMEVKARSERMKLEQERARIVAQTA
jgi:hypothetical protein